MYDTVKQSIDSARNIVVIQPENPDADSLATSLALEEILGDLGKSVSLYCAIDMPKYLRYIEGWARVNNEWTGKYDLALIVDTATETLIAKALTIPGIRHFLETHPTIVLDHHGEGDENDNDLSFPHEFILDSEAAATSELIYTLATTAGWTINVQAANHMLTSILGDTLGLSTPSVTVRTFETATALMKLGANPATIEQARREFMRKPADILAYKGKLIQRIEYHCDGRLALVHIPWEDIEAYSDRYNPSILVLDEMRLVDGVDIAIAIKTYPDRKLTGKIRSNLPIADSIAGYFGGGGHAYSAGYKIYEDYESAIHELIKATDTIIRDYDSTKHAD